MEQQDRELPSPRPVTRNGVRYEVVDNARMRGFEQAGGVIAAIDTTSKKERWVLKVYDVAFTGGEETDAEENFITSLEFDAKANVLLVTDERSKTYRVDAETGKLLP